MLLFLLLPVAFAYNFTTSSPACRPTYCPAPYSTNEYSSAFERTLFTLTNTARTRPREYAASQNLTYACTATARAPYIYDMNLQQAAKQQSWFLEQRGCPFQHNTCSQFCNLYRSCTFADRIQRYVSPNWTGLGENIQMSSSRDAFAILNNWLRSSGHCSAIFSAKITHMGVGIFQNSYTQTFASFSSPPPSLSMVDGSHVVVNGRLRVFLSFLTQTPPTLLYNSTRYTMSRGATAWTASFVIPTGGCVPYAFQTATQRLPPTGFYATSGVSTCTRNLF